MKIALVSPYFPKHFGGGEKYLLDTAKILVDQGHEVLIAVSQTENLNAEKKNEIKKNYESFLDYSLEGIDFIASPLGTDSSFLKKLLWTKNFDLIYYQSDGSLFFSLAKKNILHMQVPLNLNKSSLVERLKLKNWNIKNTNSFFTKKHIEKFWKTQIDFVHQPYVDHQEFSKSLKKEKIILNVGRFFRQLHSKRQDVLIEIFEEMLKQYPKETKGWKLVLLGRVEDQEYAEEVKKKAKGLPVEIHFQVSRDELIKYYQKAAIYWHASGYQINEDQNPEKAEHFGISTTEAMAAGAVPVVINKGGQKEVLGEDLQDYLWDDKNQAINKTIELIKDQKLREELSKKAKERSLNFSKDRFKKILLKMVEGK